MIPFSVITLGHLVSPNSASTALKSFANFYHTITSKHQRRVKLYIVDESANNDMLHKQCLEQEIGDVTTILNLSEQETIESIYKSGSVFFLPVKENKDALVQESLSYGLPFIGFTKYGYEEYIDQTCGMLLKEERDEENVIEFARLLQLLYFDPEARNFLKRGAVNKYEAAFSWGKDSRSGRSRASY